MKRHRDLAQVDFALASFELEEAASEVSDLVSAIFGGTPPG
ncbi:MAG: hypothetical protein ABSF15_19140 [Candidatus Sulfotelmatobacter sp.]